jgi:plasmid replication initiation protein
MASSAGTADTGSAVSPAQEVRNRTYINNDQLDLFMMVVTDLPLRDQRETMERPFFSLSKSKRLKPINYMSPDGKVSVYVSANPDYGMATIWDLDILIFCASVLHSQKRDGRNDIPQTLHFMPYDLLKAIGRPTTGRAYQLLGQSLDRLQSTTVKTNIRANSRKEVTFSWIDSYTHLVDERTERTRGMSVTLAKWFYDGVLMENGVLSIDSEYFNITGGRERWLYRVARKHAGGADETGFAIRFPVLFDKSGAEGSYRRFKFELLAIAKRNDLLGYHLQIEQSGGEPMLRMIRRDKLGGTEARASSKPKSRERLAPQKPSPVTEASIETLDRLRDEFPGWDYGSLEEMFREWLREDESRTPANYDRAFYGFVKHYHDRNKHQLRG